MSPSLTTDTARALGGPEWLSAIRVAAAEQAATAGLPTDALEEWRYSRIGELDVDHYAVPSAEGTADGASGGLAAAPVDPAAAALVTMVDGRLLGVSVADGLEAEGLRMVAASSSSTPLALPGWSAPAPDAVLGDLVGCGLQAGLLTRIEGEFNPIRSVEADAGVAVLEAGFDDAAFGHRC